MGQQDLLDSKNGRYKVSRDCIYSIRNLAGEGCNQHNRRYAQLATA